MPAKAVDEPLVVEVAGGDHDQVAGQVPAAEELGDLVAGGGLDRLAGAEHLAAERVAREQGLGQQGVDVVLGHVEVHEDLLDDHLALGVDLVGPERRVGEHVAEDVDAEVDPVGRQPRVVRGVLAVGEGVHLAAHRVDRLGDLAGRAGGRALEQQVLEEVRRARQLGGLVAPADTDPDAERHRPGLGHALGDDAHAVGQACLSDLFGRCGGRHERVGSAALPAAAVAAPVATATAASRPRRRWPARGRPGRRGARRRSCPRS